MRLSIYTQCLKRIYNKGYRIINGDIYNSKGKKLKKRISKNTGYYVHSFTFKGKTTALPLHRLVAYQKFGDKIFEEGIQVRHLDSNALNNLDNNIVLGTASQNMMDIPKEIRLRRAIYASSFKRVFTDGEIKNILEDRKLGLTYVQLCEKYNTSKSTLSYFFNHALYAK